TILTRLAIRSRAYAVLTLHRPGNVDDSGALEHLLDAIGAISTDVPVVFPVHPRTRPRLEASAELRRAGHSIKLVEPLPYLDFLALLRQAVCVLTDSGGVQEETTVLGVPCLTLRPNTERPITTTAGTNRIVGRDGARIAQAWDEIRRGQWTRGRVPDLW